MEYPSNSHKVKPKDEAPEPKKLERVTSGDVVRRKKPLGKKIASMFAGDSAKDTWAYILFDVIVPSAKDMIVDTVTQGIERRMYGDVRNRNRSSRRPAGNSGYVSYNRYSKPPFKSEREEQRSISRRGRSSHDFDEIILATRVEAEEVIERLFDLVSKYETATVEDLYELVGVTGSYTDASWGWTDLRGAGVSQIRGGYLLDLPKPEPLD